MLRGKVATYTGPDCITKQIFSATLTERARHTWAGVLRKEMPIDMT